MTSRAALVVGSLFLLLVTSIIATLWVLVVQIGIAAFLVLGLKHLGSKKQRQESSSDLTVIDQIENQEAPHHHWSHDVHDSSWLHRKAMRQAWHDPEQDRD